MDNKIGVAIITCNRPEFFWRCVDSVPSADELIVVNDGKSFTTHYPAKITHSIQHPRNLGVAAAKNSALRYLMEKNCEHLFLIEDDIIIKNPDIYKKYIKAASVSGIWHMNYGLHGNYNRSPVGEPNVKNSIEYEPGVEVAFYHNILGAFSYYLRGIIKHVGYMDERFHNAFEHVDHTYRIIKLGLHPPFWYFADIAESWKDIEDIKENFEGSKIRNEKEWQKNFQRAMIWFRQKHGTVPQEVPQAPDEDALKRIEQIQKSYAKPISI